MGSKTLRTQRDAQNWSHGTEHVMVSAEMGTAVRFDVVPYRLTAADLSAIVVTINNLPQ
jgi:hypothetical protein